MNEVIEPVARPEASPSTTEESTSPTGSLESAYPTKAMAPQSAAGTTAALRPILSEMKPAGTIISNCTKPTTPNR